MRFLLIFGFLFTQLIVLGQKTPFDPSKLYYMGLQGNVKEIIDIVNAAPDNTLDSIQAITKKKYLDRFYYHKEPFNYKTSDTLTIRLMKIYQEYWDNILLKELSGETADSLLGIKIGDYLWKIAYEKKGISKDSVVRNFTSFTESALNERGIKTANGKTSGIYDLLLWGHEEEVTYKVKLPESKQRVKVFLMDSVVSYGWEEYATFGKYYPGGWSTNASLHCFKGSYKLETENYKISYLKHEGQHFADMRRYPKLSSADLEYRAKLTELCYAEKTIYSLLEFFINNSGNNRSNSHSYANKCLMRDLSKVIFNSEMETDTNKWKSISVTKINRAAKKLLRKNTEALKKIGVSVTELI